MSLSQYVTYIFHISLKPEIPLGSYFAVMIGAFLGLKMLCYFALLYQEKENEIYDHIENVFGKIGKRFDKKLNTNAEDPESFNIDHIEVADN